jgi:hypothetical protein
MTFLGYSIFRQTHVGFPLYLISSAVDFYVKSRPLPIFVVFPHAHLRSIISCSWRFPINLHSLLAKIYQLNPPGVRSTSW